MDTTGEAVSYLPGIPEENQFYQPAFSAVYKDLVKG
jgi:hypothetical protein